MSLPKYNQQRKREMLRELKKVFATDEYLLNGGAVQFANSGGVSAKK